MKDRIIQFLSENNLTSTKFADKIGVQRSSISHILSGRNKPSFDFIEKMLLAYPELDAQWLITGKGNMYTNQSLLFNELDNDKKETLTPRESNIQKSLDDNTKKDEYEEEKPIEPLNKDINYKESANIERVIIFYNNGSFKEYKPGQ